MIAEQKYYTDDRVAQFRLKDKNIDLEVNLGEICLPCEFPIIFGQVANKEVENFEWNIGSRIPYRKINSQLNTLFGDFITQLSKSIENVEELHTRNQRDIEFEWIENNLKTLETYKGQWICIEKERLISSNVDLPTLIKDARKANVKKPFVYYVHEPSKKINLGL